MQAQLFCATCNKPLALKVPDLSGNRWHTSCEFCGARTALEAKMTEPGELATFSATGVLRSP